jgi:2-aminobenzoate-CoA ligase
MLGPSGHKDTFARDNLPPAEEWPEIRLGAFDYPEWLNVGVELTDRMVERGFGDHTALIGNGRRRTYKELADWSNRIAHALVEDYGVRPGNRVLIRSANNPAMVACWLGATKAGAVVVNTMPMLRAGELQDRREGRGLPRALRHAADGGARPLREGLGLPPDDRGLRRDGEP